MIPAVFVSLVLIGGIVSGAIWLGLFVRRRSSRLVKDLLAGMLLTIVCYGAVLLFPLAFALPIGLLMGLFLAADIANRKEG